MAIDFNAKFREYYDKLTANTSNQWEVYAGEDSAAVAEELGLPSDKWAMDSTEMQLYQELMADMYAKGLPKTMSELDSRMRELASHTIESRLQLLDNDTARLGLLLQTLRVSTGADERQMAKWSHLGQKTLHDMVVEQVMECTIHHTIPALQRQLGLLTLSPKEEPVQLDNAGAVAAAGYFVGTEKIQEMSEEGQEVQGEALTQVAGSSAEIINQCNQLDDTPENTLMMIATGLMLFAIGFTCITLLMASSAAIGATAGSVLVDGTVKGLGAAIASELSLMSDVIVSTLKMGLGTAILGGVVALVGKIVGFLSSRSNGHTDGHVDQIDVNQQEDLYQYTQNIVTAQA